MKVKVNLNAKKYKKARIQFIIYNYKNEKLLIGIIILFFIFLITHILNKIAFVFFYPEKIDLLVRTIGIGLVVMFLYDLFSFFKEINHINKEVKIFKSYRRDLNLTKKGIYISKNNLNHHLFEWKEFKCFIVFWDFIYILPSYEGGMEIVIDKNNLDSRESFDQIIEYLNNNLNKM